MRMEAAAEEFLRFIQYERGCSVATAEAYASDLRRFIAYLQAQDVPPNTSALSPRLLRGYGRRLSEDGYNPATVRRRCSALASLCRHLISIGKLACNPCEGLVLPKKRRRTSRLASRGKPSQISTKPRERNDQERAPADNPDYRPQVCWPLLDRFLESLVGCRLTAQYHNSESD